jgi:hypothetical protein
MSGMLAGYTSLCYYIIVRMIALQQQELAKVIVSSYIYILLASICIAVKTVVYKFSRVSLTLKLTYLLDHMRKCVLCLYHVILSICLLIF